MQVTHKNENKCKLSFTPQEIDGLAKTSVYIKEIEKKLKAGEPRKKKALFESLVDFLLSIRKGFFQITN